jgi:hypothetical protein
VSEGGRRVADLVEIHELCSRYMAYASQYVVDKWLEVFTSDGEYSAFGTKYPLGKLPELLAAAPRGQFIGNMPVVDFHGPDRATGVQHYVFIDQKTHDMRLFLRKHGGFDSGRQHDPLAAPESKSRAGGS